MTYAMLCVVGFRASSKLRKDWRKEESSAGTNRRRMKEPEERRKGDLPENEHLYQHMAEIHHPIPDTFPFSGHYDQLPLHTGWPVTKGDTDLAKTPSVCPATWDSSCQKEPVRKVMTRSADVLCTRTTSISRRSSLLTVAVLTLLCLSEATATSQPRSVTGLNNFNDKGFQEYETVKAQNGTDVSLFCKVHDLYGGDISWVGNGQEIPVNKRQSGAYLILSSVRTDINITCLVRKGFSTFRNDFRVTVVGSQELTELELPRMIEAYDCSSPLTQPLAKVSTSTEDCRLNDYASYQRKTDQSYLLLGRDRITKTQASRCHIKLEINQGKCDGKELSGFIRIFQGLYDTDLKQCKELHKQGKTNLVVHRKGFLNRWGDQVLPCIKQGEDCLQRIDGELVPARNTDQGLWTFGGPSSFQDPLIGPMKKGSFFSKLMFLGGSGVNSSDPSNHCWKTSRTYYMGPGAGVGGFDHSIGKPSDPVVVTMYLTALLDEEPAFIDYKELKVRFLRLGTELHFDKPGDVVHFSNSESGITFLEVMEEKDDGFFAIKDNITGRFFTDITNQQNPDIVTLDFHEKNLALQTHNSFTLKNRTKCFHTHLDSIFICQDFPPEKMTFKPEVLSELASQRHLFLQINVAESTKSMLFHICKNRKVILDLAISDFSNSGGLLFGLKRGVFHLQIGEDLVIFQCDVTIASIVRVPQSHCTTQLPVLIH